MMQRPDVIVIGAGLVGLCSAWFAARNGMRVMVLEREPEPNGCSYGNAGLIVPSHIVPLAAPGVISTGLQWMLKSDSPFYIRPTLRPEMLRWLWHFWRACQPIASERGTVALDRLLQAGMQAFEILEQELSITPARNGLLMLSKSREGYHEERELAHRVRQKGQEIAFLPKTALQELEPDAGITAYGGVHYLGDGHLDPAAMATRIVLALRDLDVDIRYGVAVRDFVLHAGQISALKTSAGEMEADQFVLAAGTWSGDFARQLGLHVPLQGGKGYSLTVDMPEFKLRTPLLLTEAKAAVTPLPGGRVRFAGTLELCGLDTRVNATRFAGIIASLSDYFEDLKVPEYAKDEIWAGLRPCSPDGLPYIGRASRPSNLLIAAGHAMLGLTLAPITGQLIAETLIELEPAVDLIPFRPERYH